MIFRPNHIIHPLGIGLIAITSIELSDAIILFKFILLKSTVEMKSDERKRIIISSKRFIFQIGQTEI